MRLQSRYLWKVVKAFTSLPCSPRLVKEWAGGMRTKGDRQTGPSGKVQLERSRFFLFFLAARAEWAKRLFLTNIAFASLLFKSMVARHQSPRPNSYQSMLHRGRQLADKGSSLSHLLFCQWGTQHQGQWMGRWVLDHLHKVYKQQGEGRTHFKF